MTRSLLAVVFAGLVLAACGGGDDGESAAPPRDSAAETSAASTSAGGTVSGTGHPVTINAFDLYFEPKEQKVPAGTLDITYVNQGEIYHTLKVDGAKGLTLEVNKKGDRDTGSITLKPGQYVFYCDLPGHRLAGMETRVTAE